MDAGDDVVAPEDGAPSSGQEPSVEEDPAHGIQPMPSPQGVEGATDFSVIDE